MFTKVVTKSKRKDRNICNTTPSISQITVVNESQELITGSSSHQKSSHVVSQPIAPFGLPDSIQMPESTTNQDT